MKTSVPFNQAWYGRARRPVRSSRTFARAIPSEAAHHEGEGGGAMARPKTDTRRKDGTRTTMADPVAMDPLATMAYMMARERLQERLAPAPLTDHASPSPKQVAGGATGPRRGYGGWPTDSNPPGLSPEVERRPRRWGMPEHRTVFQVSTTATTDTCLEAAADDDGGATAH